LTPTRLAVLQTVNRDGPMRLSELAESEGINPTMLSRLTTDLVEAGLLTRVSGQGDRRAAWAEPTAAGRRLVERIRRERTDAVKLALDALPESERRRIDDALSALELFAEQLKGERP
jgi:DNA-binding MarR family transcriptional regulator